MLWRRLMLAVSDIEQVPIHVLDRLGRLGRGLDAHIELFHCLYEPESVQGSNEERAAHLIAARVEERRRRLERLADVLRDQNLHVGASVRWDFPTYEGIIRHALRYRPDLLIVPAIRLDGTLRTLAYRESRLIEECPCPVLFLKTREIYSRGCIVAALAQHDGEAADLDERILGAARTVAHALAKSPLCVFSVVSPGRRAWSGAAAAGYDVRNGSGPQQPAVSLGEVQARMRRLALRHEIPPGEVRVEYGEPAVSLALYARQSRTQMVVLGVRSALHPDDGSERLAERVLDSIECDLLVVKPSDAPVTVDTVSAPAVPHPA